MPEPQRTEAAQRIMDTAEQLAQTCGFNGFSYADIAVRLGVTKASLHYHFPTKAELGRALIARYHVKFAQELAAIGASAAGPSGHLRSYMDLYYQVMRNDRMCLCGMFAAEYSTLPAPMQEELRRFFDSNERWLAEVLEAGLRDGAFAFKNSPRDLARILLGTLEGALLIARTYGDDGRFRSVAEHLMVGLAS